MKTAALIVIGDEILSGKIKDENSFVFAQTMFQRGVDVARIETIPDCIDNIASTVCNLKTKVDYLCTSGGVGPTHDDLTFEGIAKALDLPLQIDQDALSYFDAAQKKSGRGDHVSDAQKKMLLFPTPCKTYFVEPLWLPLVQAQNVFVFPGIPFLFETLITNFAYLFSGEKKFRQYIFTDQSEATIAESLSDFQKKYPDVAIGSYPKIKDAPYSVMVSMEGLSEKKVNDLAQKIMAAINGRSTKENN